MEPVEVQPSLPSGLPAPVTASLDVISKSVAAFALLLYGCGYLITSIYYSGYGFTETSPLRPRIVAAGAWFLLFTLVPFALVKGVLKSKEYLRSDGEWWYKVPTFLFLYFSACWIIARQASWIFDLDDYTVPGSPSPIHWWQLLIAIVFLILGILVSMVFSRKSGNPHPIIAILAAASVAYTTWNIGHEMFVSGYFRIGAIVLWLFAVGIIAFLEMSVRSWSVKLGDWTWSTILLLGALLTFASFYYPHLKSSWGGGKPIPVTIYFTKDSVLLPGQSVNALLIDETDTGLYVVGKNDKKATLIPHSSVGLVYFSDNVSDLSLTKPK